VKKAQEQGRTIQKRIYIYKNHPQRIKNKPSPETPIYPQADFVQNFD
jgi:hypothetical protein